MNCRTGGGSREETGTGTWENLIPFIYTVPRTFYVEHMSQTTRMFAWHTPTTAHVTSTKNCGK